MKIARIGLFCMLVTFVTNFAAHASVITNNVVLDLSQATLTNDIFGGYITGYGATQVPVPAFAPNAGDTLVTTVTFADGARLKIIDGPHYDDQNGPDYFEYLLFYFNGSPSVSSQTNTTNVVFLGLEGSLTDPTGPNGFASGLLVQGLVGDFTDSYISFTGLTMTTQITNHQNPDSGSYDHFGLYVGSAGGIEIIGAATTVPEPASIIFWSVGLATLGLRTRLRRKSRPLHASSI